ncbi:MAG: RNHCP domain-containing protein [Clostridia bacterium]
MQQQFKKNDSGFICENCKKVVPPLGYSSRNHCPFCLASKHVDINPGDRENSCSGIMKAVIVEPCKKGGYTITFKCTKCGEIKRNKSAKDDSVETMLQIIKNNSK